MILALAPGAKKVRDCFSRRWLPSVYCVRGPLQNQTGTPGARGSIEAIILDVGQGRPPWEDNIWTDTQVIRSQPNIYLGKHTPDRRKGRAKGWGISVLGILKNSKEPIMAEKEWKGDINKRWRGAALADGVFPWSIVRPCYGLQPGKTSDCQILLKKIAPHCLGIQSPLSKINSNYNFHKALSCFTLTNQIGKGYDLEHWCYLKVDCYLQHKWYFLETEGPQERVIGAWVSIIHIRFAITLM